MTMISDESKRREKMIFIDSLQSCKVSCITTIDYSTEYIKVQEWFEGKISRENRIC